MFLRCFSSGKRSLSLIDEGEIERAPLKPRTDKSTAVVTNPKISFTGLIYIVVESELYPGAGASPPS